MLVEFEIVGTTLEDLVALGWLDAEDRGEPRRGGGRDRRARRPRAGTTRPTNWLDLKPGVVSDNVEG